MSSSATPATAAPSAAILFPRTTALRIARYYEKVKNAAAEKSIKTTANRNKGKDNADEDDEEVKQLMLLVGHHTVSSKSAVELVTRFAEGASPAPVTDSSDARVASTVAIDAFSCVAVDVLEEQIDNLAATLPGGLTVVGIACMDGIPSLQNLLPGVKTIKQEVQEVLQSMKSNQSSKAAHAQVDLSRLLWVSVAPHRPIEEDGKADEARETTEQEPTVAPDDLLGLFGRDVFIPKYGASFLAAADVPSNGQEETEEEKENEEKKEEQKEQKEEDEKEKEEKGEEEGAAAAAIEKEEEPAASEKQEEPAAKEEPVVTVESTWELDIKAELIFPPPVSTSVNDTPAKGDKKKSKKKNSVTGESVDAGSVSTCQNTISVLVSELNEAEIFCRVDVVLNPIFLTSPLLVFSESTATSGSFDRKTDYTIPLQKHGGSSKGDSLLALHKVLGGYTSGQASNGILPPAALALQLGVTVPTGEGEASSSADSLRFTFLLPLFFVNARDFSELVRKSLVQRTAHLNGIRETFAKQLDGVDGATLSTSQYAAPLRHTKEDEGQRVLFFVEQVAQAHSKAGSPTKAEKKLNAKLIETAWEAYESKVIDGCDLEDEDDVDSHKPASDALPPLREEFLPLCAASTATSAPASKAAPTPAATAAAAVSEEPPKPSKESEPTPAATPAATEDSTSKATPKPKEDSPAEKESAKEKEDVKGAKEPAVPEKKKKNFASSNAYWAVLASGYVIGIAFIVHIFMGANERNRLYEQHKS